MRLTVSIKNTEYTKGKFEKKWTEVVKGTECNFFVRGADEEFICVVVDIIPRCKSIKDKGGGRYKIRNKKFKGRAVRGIVMITPRSKTEVWLGKGKIVDDLFPRSKPVPEYKKNKKNALSALRSIIEPQIKMFKQSVNRQLQRGKPLKCSISKEFISAGEWHADHVYPFSNLVEEWCREEHIDLENVEVYCKGVKCYLRDTRLAENFFDYHMLHAKLQPLSAVANLQKGKKYYG